MKIGIDGSRAFLPYRTGVEEYSYQVIKHLTNELFDQEVLLYLRKGQEKNIDFSLPENWKIRVIAWSRFWTQIGLSWEMLIRPVEVLFIPAHIVSFFHPRRTIVVIHGLEYEFLLRAYSFWERLYMRFFIRNSCRWAEKIIAVSENTKKDLITLYQVPREKIKVIYEGINLNHKLQITNYKSNSNNQISNFKNLKLENNSKFLLFIGRLEERKNIIGIIKAFEILKKKPEFVFLKLVLAGRGGYGYEEIKKKIRESEFQEDIIETGYVSEEEKWDLLQRAEVFLFPTFYEGFGLPVLEAQSAGIPVVAGNNSSIPEVVSAGGEKSASLVDPNKSEEIAVAVSALLKDKNFKNTIIQKGKENISRFSWAKCAREIAKVLIDN